MLFVFLQISASTPEVLDLQFPDIYLQFLSYFDWLDFNFISLLGLDCIGELDYRSEVGISCLVPTLIVVLGMIVYQCQNKGSKVLGKDEKRKFTAGESKLAAEKKCKIGTEQANVAAKQAAKQATKQYVEGMVQTVDLDRDNSYHLLVILAKGGKLPGSDD